MQHEQIIIYNLYSLFSSKESFNSNVQFKINISIALKVDQIKTAQSYSTQHKTNFRIIRVIFASVIIILLINIPPHQQK